jgi:hypothetical protein
VASKYCGQPEIGSKNVEALLNGMGVSPIRSIFTQLWLLCAAVRPSIDEEAWAALVRSYPKTRKTKESLNPSTSPQSSNSSAARKGKGNV